MTAAAQDPEAFESELVQDHMSGEDAAKTLLIHFGSEQCSL